jgi:hypothetical protein
VPAQPRREGVGGPIRQEIQGSVGADVDDDRAVDVSSAQREVVHAQDLRGPDRWVGQGADQPQHAVPADGHREFVGEAGAGAPGQRQSDRLQRHLQQPGPSGPWGRQPGHLLGERPSRTTVVVAEEPADPQHDRDRPTADGRIGQVAAVAAVHPGGEQPAPGAPRRAGTDSGHQPHATGSGPDIVEHDAVQVRQQPDNKITWPVIIQPGSLRDRVTRRALITQSAPEPFRIVQTLEAATW